MGLLGGFRLTSKLVYVYPTVIKRQREYQQGLRRTSFVFGFWIATYKSRVETLKSAARVSLSSITVAPTRLQ